MEIIIGKQRFVLSELSGRFRNSVCGTVLEVAEGDDIIPSFGHAHVFGNDIQPQSILEEIVKSSNRQHFMVVPLWIDKHRPHSSCLLCSFFVVCSVV